MNKNNALLFKRKKWGRRDVKDMVFVAILSVLPMLQFLIFYVYVNINSVVMAFQTYKSDPVSGSGGYVWYGMRNFVRAWKEFAHDKVLLIALKNSAITFVTGIAVGTVLALFFSYYIYKKRMFSSAFKVMLFLPSILSAIVMVLLYKNFVNFAIPKLWEKLFHAPLEGLTSTSKTRFPTVLFYCIWSGFGTQILLYSGAMSSISDSLVEAAQLDGANLLQEFWHITLPQVFPTLSTFLIASTAGFFTADLNLFSFYSTNAEAQTWTTGYYLLRAVKLAGTAEYPYLACLGLIYTAVTLLCVFGVKKLLQKVGPSTY